jgi:hypothetical protein
MESTHTATITAARPAARSAEAPTPSRLLSAAGSARGLALAGLACIAAAAAIAALAGHTMIAWWTIASVVPIVTPVTLAYSYELTIFHGGLIVPILATVGVVLGLAALARGAGVLDEL